MAAEVGETAYKAIGVPDQVGMPNPRAKKLLRCVYTMLQDEGLAWKGSVTIWRDPGKNV